MKLLDRYISLAILRNSMLVLLVLLAVFSFIDLVQQLDDVGKGDFQTGDAFRYVSLSLPARAVELMPIAALLGTIVGLGILNRNSELTAMRACGLSLQRIAAAVLKTALLLLLVTAITGEWLAPPAAQEAERGRALAVSRGSDILGEEGYWTRDGARFLNIHRLHLGRVPSDIRLFEFDADGRLRSYLYARKAEMETTRQWLLKDVVIKRFAAGTPLETLQRQTLAWRPLPALTEFGRFELPARSLAPSNLYQYIAYLRAAGENTQRFEILFWHKLMTPVSIAALMLLAMPFAFGSLRSASFGLRVVLGVIAGLLYVLADQLLGNIALLTGTSAALMAALPPLAAAVTGLFLLQRIR